jgi:class 3 adenylate cyclase
MSATQSHLSLASQCGICGTVLAGPLRHLFHLVGIKRSPRNPNICNRCGAHVQEGRLVEVTVLFADLSSFTELTQELGAERTHEIVDAFLRTASAAITKFGGFIDKYIGDAAMALFNVPVKLEDHPRRAVAAALELQSNMAALRERFQMDLKTAAGIASGWARVGRVGSSDNKDFTAIGDVVNLAARLEGKTNPGEVLVSRETYDKVAADFPDVAPEQLALKGFKEAVPAYRLHGGARPPRIEAAESESKRGISWGAVIFGLLGAPCAVTTLISPLAVILGVGTLFGLSGALAFLDQGLVRIPVLIFAALAALANLYTLWHARQLRAQAAERLAGMTRPEKRSAAIILVSATASLLMVVFEIIAHALYHGSPL